MKTFTSNIERFDRPAGVYDSDFRLTSMTYIQAKDDPSWEFPLRKD